jgi:hypothetical protein
MGKKRRQQQGADEAELLSRELAWLEASSRPSAQIIYGVPMRCPQAGCNDFGLVESMADGRQHNRCWSCGMSWTLSRKAMALFAQACKAPTAPTVVGAGTLVADLEPPAAARTTRERLAGVLHREPAPAPVRYLPNP